MRRAAAIATLAALTGCSEPPPGPTTRPRSDGDAMAGPVVVEIGLDTIVVGGEPIVAARPASAPGMLDADLRASHAYPELTELRVETIEVHADDGVPVASVRGVWSSMVAPGTAARLVVGDAEPIVLHRRGEVPTEAVVLDLPDDSSVADLVAAAQATRQGTTLVLAIDHAPCLVPPEGMACVPGPPSTYYSDQHDVTDADYDECHAAGACRIRDRSAARLDWFRARGYCAWKGKRLPTEEEASEGTRCATTDPFLTAYPPMHVTSTREPPPDPEPPTEGELAIVAAVQDDPIHDKPICGAEVRADWSALQAEGGRAETWCRDPFSYLRSNEPRGDHWARYIENLGGAYVGIGSDQNYSHIAIARSQWAWVVDHDPRVYGNHLRLRAFVLAAATPRELVELFASENQRQAVRILEAAYPGRRDLVTAYVATRAQLHAYYAEQSQPHRVDFGWLRNAEHYAYVRTLFEQGRLRPVAGDLLGESAMTGIGAACEQLGVPVRVYYTSNAPSSWGGEITDAYRSNVLALPFDAWSVVLQTTGEGGFRQSGKWHHNVMWGRTMHERMQSKEYFAIWKLIADRIPGHHGDVTLLGLPSGVLP